MFDTVVSVPTVERAPPAVLRCSSATVGGSPATDSTFGSIARPISRRANGATDSRYRRCDSACRVPNASDDLPDPETPVNATSRPRGSRVETCRRLCSRASRTLTIPDAAPSGTPAESLVTPDAPDGPSLSGMRTTYPPAPTIPRPPGGSAGQHTRWGNTRAGQQKRGPISEAPFGWCAARDSNPEPAS